MADYDEQEQEEREEKRVKEPEEKGGWSITIISVFLLVGGITGIVFSFPGWITTVLWLVWPMALVLAIWSEWAPKDFNVGFVEEGTVRAAVRGKAARGFYLQKIGSHLADESEVSSDGPAFRKWDIIPDKIPRKKNTWKDFFGGLIFIGIYPFQKMLDTIFEWFHIHADGKLYHHKERISSFLVKWDAYGISIFNIENKDKMPMTIVFTIPMRIINPYEALFEVRRWLPMVMSVLLPPLRRFVPQHTYEELLSMKPSSPEKTLSPGLPTDDLRDESRKQILEELEEKTDDIGTVRLPPDDLRDELRKQILEELEEKTDDIGTVRKISESRLRMYGVELDWGRAGFSNLDPDEEYRRLTTLVYEAEQTAKATKIAGAAEGAATAQRIQIPVMTIARVLAGFAEIPEEELTEEQKKEIMAKIPLAMETYLTQQAIEAIKPSDTVVITPGASSLGPDVAGLTVRETVRKKLGKRIEPETKEKTKEE